MHQQTSTCLTRRTTITGWLAVGVLLWQSAFYPALCADLNCTTPEGQKVSTSSPSGVTRYGYDVQGRLSGISDQPDGAATPTNLASYRYDAVGNLDTLTRGNGVTTRYNYDELNRLKKLTHLKGAQQLSHFTYSVRGDGKRTALEEALVNADEVNGVPRVSNREVGYSYDAAGKLLSEVGRDGRGVAYENLWDYDKVGNHVADGLSDARITSTRY